MVDDAPVFDEDVERIDFVDDFKSNHPPDYHRIKTQDYLAHLPRNPLIVGFEPATEARIRACGLRKGPPIEDDSKLKKKSQKWWEIIDARVWAGCLVPSFYPQVRI